MSMSESMSSHAPQSLCCPTGGLHRLRSLAKQMASFEEIASSPTDLGAGVRQLPQGDSSFSSFEPDMQPRLTQPGGNRDFIYEIASKIVTWGFKSYEHCRFPCRNSPSFAVPRGELLGASTYVRFLVLRLGPARCSFALP